MQSNRGAHGWARSISALWLIGLVLLTSSAWADVTRVGNIERVTGTVNITDPGGVTRAAQQNSDLNEGDTIVTGDDGEVLFKMVDDGAIALRPKTEMRVTKYHFKSEAGDSALLNIARGSMRVLTGLIGKLHPEATSVRTPSATIGIRGTDHETLVLLDDTPDGDAGTYERVYTGETYIEAQNGTRLPVTANQVGFAPLDVLKIAAQLGLLKKVPPFFLTGKFDDLFALLEQALEQRIINQGLSGKANSNNNPAKNLLINNLGNLFK